MAAFGRQRREVLLGGAIILALTAFAFGVFFLDAFLAAVSDNDEIVAVLPEAPKLTMGSDVWIGGKHVGRVTKVEFMAFHGDSMARIAATLEFPHDVHAQIRKDSHIRITSARIIGAPVIDISPGTAASPIIGHGDTIFLPDIPTLVKLHAKVEAIAAAFDTATIELKALAGPAKARLATLGPVMHRMEAAQVELASLMDAMQNGAASQFMADGKFAGELASLQRTAAALGPAFAAVGRNINGSKESIAPSLKRMQGNAERLSVEIDQLQKMMQDSSGTFYRMRADSALLKTLHTMKAQLDSLIVEAKKNPLKFVM